MNGTWLVWIAVGRLTMLAPGGLIYHRYHDQDWRLTACGKPYERDGRRAYTAVRWDTATRIARACRFCWPNGGPE